MIKLGFTCALALWMSAAVVGQEATGTTPQLRELGRSVRGLPINAVVYGCGKRRVLVLGAIHGDEGAGTAVARTFAQSLEQEPLADELTLIVVPAVNPDGLAAGSRVNANGVDLNRNFPAHSWRPEYRDLNHYPGKQPASEPETRAIIQLIERYPPSLIVTLHAALGCVNWDGPADEVARLMAVASGYSLCSYLGYETPGSLGQYAGRDLKIPVVSIELGGDTEYELLWTRTLHTVITRISFSQAKAE